MEIVSVGEIRRDPLGYLRRVEAGETLLVVRADRSVAEIKPVDRVPDGKRLQHLSRPEGDGPFRAVKRSGPGKLSA
jgi:antitoxin (DNA-binding transcriptional repressor) of toxin-antitoxin stability system